MLFRKGIKTFLKILKILKYFEKIYNVLIFSVICSLTFVIEKVSLKLIIENFIFLGKT